MATLLDPLGPDQQELVDLIANAYVEDHGRWPIFDYLEAQFDTQRKDAWQTLYSLPRFGRWNYGAARWGNPYQRPAAEKEIELTILGMHHSEALRDRVSLFLETLGYMIEIRLGTPPSTREPRRVEITAALVREMRARKRRTSYPGTLVDRLPALWGREPVTWNGREDEIDGAWTKEIPRDVLDYEGVSSIEEYIDRLEALSAIPATAPAAVVPSPLGLVAALDYLDMAWRVAHGCPLFAYPSAERAAKLSHAAGTPEELDARLTALGEILRTANATVRAAKKSKLRKPTHAEPLAPLRDFLGRDGRRVAAAIATLEDALSIRDATQHTEAGGRAVVALTQEFGLAHPIRDPGEAWAAIGSRVVSALGAIREEVATTSPRLT